MCVCVRGGGGGSGKERVADRCVRMLPYKETHVPHTDTVMYTSPITRHSHVYIPYV